MKYFTDSIFYSPRKKRDEKYFIKELPYSWYILVENFMDPAHIPFAHHGLQGKRSDGKPIKIKLKNMRYPRNIKHNTI